MMTNGEFLLRNMRCAVLRIKLIAEEVSMVGTLLRDELISPELALEWVEDIAPGCLLVVAESVLEGAHG